jgi:hypothetical protein
MPAAIKERNEVVLGELSGKDLPQFPKYYMPYDEHMSAAGRAARPIAELQKLNPARIADIDSAIQASGRMASDVGYLPLRAKHRDQSVLVGKSDGKVLALLKINPYPPSALSTPDKK